MRDTCTSRLITSLASQVITKVHIKLTGQFFRNTARLERIDPLSDLGKLEEREKEKLQYPDIKSKLFRGQSNEEDLEMLFDSISFG